MDVSSGTQIGAFVVDRLLARGAYGPVYLARHASLGKRAVLRFVPPELLARFRAAAALDHAAVVRVLDAGEERGVPYVATEYVEGRSLERILQDRGRLSPLEAVLIGRQIAAALAVAHRRGIHHGTLKPSSVFVTRNGTVQIADFALADADVVTDLRALGAILYRALTGLTPGPAMRPAHNVVAGLPQEAGEIVDRLLVDDPATRFASAEAAIRALSALPLDRMPMPAADDRAPDPDAMLSMSFGSLASLGEHTMLDMVPPEAPPPPPASSALPQPAPGTILDAAPPAASPAPAPPPPPPRPPLSRARIATIAAVAVAALALAWGVARHVAWVAEQDRERDIAARFDAARRAYAAADWTRALEACDAALRLRHDPEIETIARDSGRRLAEEDVRAALHTPDALPRLEGALGTLETFLLHPRYADNAELLALLGAGWLALGDLARAEARLDRALVLGAPARDALARTCLERWIAARLVDLGSPEPSAAREDAEAWRRRAAELGARDDAVRAAVTADPAQRDALLAKPARATDYLVRGALRNRRGDPAGAAADFDHALHLAPRHAPARLLRAAARERLGQRDAAIADCTRALDLDPELVDARLMRARLLLAAGRPAEALADADEAVRRRPDHRPSRLARGEARRAAGDPAGAAADFAWAVARNPRDPRAYVQRALAFVDRRALDDAIRDFDQAIYLDGRAPSAWAGRAAARALKNDPRGALSDAERALELAPPDWPDRDRLERLASAQRARLK